MDNLVEISVIYQRETNMAIGVTETEELGEDLIWIPKSQIKNLVELDDYDIKDIINVEIPEWLAIDKELI